MVDYPSISDHGLIGDLQTAALVDINGTIDWFCCPRFDSPSVFASLLDADRGGFCRIAPDMEGVVTRQLYLPGTAILVTRFMTEAGVGEVIDFMPVADGSATDRHRLVRLVRVVRGTMRFVVEIEPRFDYARKPHTTDVTSEGAVFASDALTLTLHRVGDPILRGAERASTVEQTGTGVRIATTLHAGEITGMMLEWAARRQADLPRRADRDVPRHEAVLAPMARPVDVHGALARDRHRSAMTLKLLTYAPTGAIVAAPTCACPNRWRRAQLGLPLHVGSRRVVLGVRAAWARLHG